MTFPFGVGHPDWVSVPRQFSAHSLLDDAVIVPATNGHKRYTFFPGDMLDLLVLRLVIGPGMWAEIITANLLGGSEQVERIGAGFTTAQHVVPVQPRGGLVTVDVFNFGTLDQSLAVQAYACLGVNRDAYLPVSQQLSIEDAALANGASLGPLVIDSPTAFTFLSIVGFIQVQAGDIIIRSYQINPATGVLDDLPVGFTLTPGNALTIHFDLTGVVTEVYIANGGVAPDLAQLQIKGHR